MSEVHLETIGVISFPFALRGGGNAYSVTDCLSQISDLEALGPDKRNVGEAI